MKIIRTVLGDIPADQIGAKDAHDHLIRSGGMRTRSFLAWMPEGWKDLLPIGNRLEELTAWSIFSHGLFHC